MVHRQSELFEDQVVSLQEVRDGRKLIALEYLKECLSSRSVSEMVRLVVKAIKELEK